MLRRPALRIGRKASASIASGVLLLIAHGSACAQERNLTGSLAAGWSYGRAKSILDQSRGNAFGTLRLDQEGYLLDPRFLTFHARPRFSTGFEDFYLGQFQGSGVEFDSTFLPESPWPVRFYYDRVRRLSLSSGLGTRDSWSHTDIVNSRIGVSAVYSVPDRPNLAFDFNKTAGTAEPEQVLLQGFHSKGTAYSLTGSDFRKGWKLDGFLRKQNYRDILAVHGDGAVLRDTDTGAREFQFSAERRLSPGTTFLAQAIRNSGDIQFASSRASYGFSRLRGQIVRNPMGGKLWATIQGDTGSNSARTQVAPSPVSNSNVPLTGFSTSGAERNASSVLRYFLTPYLSVSGQGQFSQVSNPLVSRPDSGQDRSRTGGGESLSGGPGIALNKGARYWNLSASYDLSLSRIRFDSETARTLGHSVGGGAAAGDPAIVRGAATYQFSKRRVQGGLLLGVQEHSQTVAFDVDKQAFHWMRLQGRLGLNRRQFDAWNLRSDNPSHDYRASLQLSRLYLSWSRQISSGGAWQLFLLSATAAGTPGLAAPVRPSLPQLAASGVPLMAHGQRIPAAAAALSTLSAAMTGPAPETQAAASGMLPLTMFIGSSASATSLTGSLMITRHATLRGTWQGQRQAVAAFLPSRFEQHNAAFDWRFRMMTVEAVYELIRFDFGTPIFHKQFMLRLTRDFRVY